MARTKTVKEKITGDNAILKAFLDENKGDHYNYNPNRIEYRVSTGSLKLDYALGGGLPPGIHRLGGSSEGGKALPKNEDVLTPEGWKKMGDIKVGDEVVGLDGSPTKVIGVYPQGEKEVFRVSFEDGASVRCCDDHLWTTQTRNERILSGKKGIDFESVRTTREIRNTLIYGERTRNHAIKYCSPVEFSKTKEHELDPYVLGVILGDGGISDKNGSVNITSVDQLLIDEVEKRLQKYSWFDCLTNNDITFRIKTKEVASKGNEVKRILSNLGLMGLRSENKFIPKEYIYLSSVKDREDLLRGLMDTDGYCKPESCMSTFYSVGEELAKGVQELVWSLGGRASITKKKGKYYSHKYEKFVSCKDCFKVNISFTNDIQPFFLKRKLDNHRKKTEYTRRLISKIEPEGVEDCVCIKVSNLDGLFITKDYIVTHNTSSALCIAKNFLETVKDSKLLYIKAEGRFSEKIRISSGIKFVDSAEKWEPGTGFVIKSNVFDTLAELIKTLVSQNERKYIIIIDSLDSLMLKDDVDKRLDKGDHVKVAGPQLLTKRLFKLVSLPVHEFGHMIIPIAQVISSIKSQYDKEEQLNAGSGGGGNAAIHFSDYIFQFMPRFKKHLIFEGSDETLDFDTCKILGHNCVIEIKKSENNISNLKLSYPIKYGEGNEPGRVWQEKEIIFFLDRLNLVEKNTSWYSLSEYIVKEMEGKGFREDQIPRKIQGLAKFEAFFEDQKIADFFINLIKREIFSDEVL